MQILSFHYADLSCSFFEKWQMFESMDNCQRLQTALVMHCFAYNFEDIALRTPPTVFLRDEETRTY
jgi:hypothetical protein